MSLRAKILCLFALFAVVPIVTVGVADHIRSIALLREVVQLKAESIAGGVASDLERRHLRQQAALEVLAGGEEVRRLYAGGAPDTAGVAALFRSGELGRRFERLEFRDRSGAVLYRYASEPLAAAGCGGRRGAGFHFELPVVGAEGALGTVAAVGRLEAVLPELALGAHDGRAGYTMLLDRVTGRVLYHPRCEWVGREARELAEVQRWDQDPLAGAGSSGSFSFREGDSSRIAAFVHLGNPAWTVASVTSAEEFVVAYGRSRTSYLLFILTVVGATSLAFSLLISRVMRSLARLTSAAEVIGRGDFTPWLPPPGGDEVGKLSFAIGSMVERIGEMLRQVEQSRQMAALGEFSAYLAHEIRNPLSSLKLNLQGAAREVRAGRITEQLSEVIESCVQEINRLDRVVHTILRLGRPEPGARTPCAVHDVVDDAVNLLAMQLQRRNIRVEVRRQAFADQVLASGEQLKGVLLNLFLNAADAMPKGGRLRVWTHNTTGRDGHPAIRVHVADDGAGVPPSLRERIFDPFFTTKRDGSGIGLSLALRTIRHHGGDLGYAKSSEMEPGAEFVITLPLLEPEGPEAGHAAWHDAQGQLAVVTGDLQGEDIVI